MGTAPSSPGSGLPPILGAYLYARIEAKLLELLRSLSAEEWERQTISPRWKVKDVAAHLLDTQLRKLSLARDGHRLPAPELRSQADLVDFINRMNADGVAAYARLSPQVLMGLMEKASAEAARFHESLDPFAPALLAVSWAGESTSANWFDTARELTERWHHQQQIRLAVERPGIMTPELYHPVLDCFLRALPHAYREQTAPPGSLVQVNVSGDCGGSWFLYRSDGAWSLLASPAGDKVAEVTIPQEIAWRIFTKGIGRAAAEAQLTVSGDRGLALHVLNLVAIVG